MKKKALYIIFHRQYFWILFFMGLPFTMAVHSNDSISTALLKGGFENLRVRKENTSVYVAYENSIYRWNVRGIIVAIDSITAHLEPDDTLHVVLVSMGIPQVAIDTKVSEWLDFRNEKISASEYDALLSVNYNTGTAWRMLANEPSANASYWKPDLVLYNQIKLVNSYYDRLFDTQINFAPTLEMSPWKGAKGTLQWLFPITNSSRVFGKEGRFIRPGFATISQQVQIRPQLYTNLAVGLFSNDRSGIDWQMIYHLNQWISLRTEAAYTGYVNVGGYLPQDWTFTTWDKFTWSAGGSYFNRQLSLLTNVAVQQYLEGNHGLRVDVTRMFGEVSVGFFGLLTGNDKSAGFHVAIPLPGSKRPRWDRFRIMLPEYFDWEYTVSNQIKGGSTFEIRPNENRVEHLFNPVYLKSQLLNFQ